MLDFSHFNFLYDPAFLSALTALIGPVAFFAAPTEEIEEMLYRESTALDETQAVDQVSSPVDAGLAEAA